MSILSNIDNELDRLSETKKEIRQAIISKGVDVPIDTPFSEYDDKIRLIPLTLYRDELFYKKTANNTDYSNLFKDFDFSTLGITTLDLSDWDTSKVDYMEDMFVNCVIDELILDNWFISDSKYTVLTPPSFAGCTAKYISVKNWDMGSLSMSNMFSNCKNLIEIDLSTWETYGVYPLWNVFEGCTNLKKINLSGCSFSSEFFSCFKDCPNLQEIRLDDCDKNTVFNVHTDTSLRRDDYNIVRQIFCKREVYDELAKSDSPFVKLSIPGWTWKFID